MTSPTKTIKENLREEWRKHYLSISSEKLLDQNDIADWWIDRLDSILEAERARVREALEGMKRTVNYALPDKGAKENILQLEQLRSNEGYNQALTDCLSLLDIKEEEI